MVETSEVIKQQKTRNYVIYTMFQSYTNADIFLRGAFTDPQTHRVAKSASLATSSGL